MPNLFVDLPLPALNGPGAAVDTSGMGVPKTIEVVGDFPGATILVEASQDGGVTFGPVVMFQNVGGKRVIEVVAEFMRVTVSGRSTSLAPFVANCDVGANNNGALFAAIAMPAGNGPGPTTNISAFGDFVSIVLGGAFLEAVVLLEISEDGVTFAPLLSFSGQGGLQSATVTASFIRANVSGRQSGMPFTATAAIGAANTATAGGGGQANPYSPPEQWAIALVDADLTDVPMSAQVSTNFDEIRMIRDGSIVGLCVRFTGAISAGSSTVAVTVNGAPGTLSVVDDGESTQAAGIDTYVAGDLVGVVITTDSAFEPILTLDANAWLQLVEAL